MLKSAVLLAAFAGAIPSPTAFDRPRLERGWHDSIQRIRESGRLPLIDLLSTFGETSMNPEVLQREMDAQGVALIAFAPTLTTFLWLNTAYEDWSGIAHRLIDAGPTRFIPVPAGGLDLALRRKDDASRFLDELFAKVLQEDYPMLGEFRFRAYPSNTEWINPTLGRSGADSEIPIDGPLGEKIFAFSQEHGLAFQIHYEIEDRLLPPLEKMLKKYPKAKVVWRSLGRVRYKSRSRLYGAQYVRTLIETHPNLYFDLSWTDRDDFYLPSGEPSSVLWDRRFGTLDSAWARLIVAYPWRFMVGLGLDQDQITQFDREAQSRRVLLLELPPEVREIVAYKTAWKFIFGRNF